VVIVAAVTLVDKKKYRGRRNRARTFRKRRRTGLYVFVGLLVLALGTLALYGVGSASRSDGEGVARVEDPTVPGAPRAVSDAPAKEKAAEERAEREKAAKAAEEKAAKDRAEREQDAKERSEKEKANAAPPPPSDPTTYLTVPRLGVYGHTVRNDTSEEALDLGAIKIPETGFPWQEGDTNTYIAGHRIGWPGTESYYQFYNLPAMQQGDEVILEDSNGTVYTYRVTEIFAVKPSDYWVTKPVPGRDVISLQTCTESVDDWWTIGPSLMESGPESGRLIVRADRIA
jgi:sortase A